MKLNQGSVKTENPPVFPDTPLGVAPAKTCRIQAQGGQLQRGSRDKPRLVNASLTATANSGQLNLRHDQRQHVIDPLVRLGLGNPMLRERVDAVASDVERLGILFTHERDKLSCSLSHVRPERDADEAVTRFALGQPFAGCVEVHRKRHGNIRPTSIFARARNIAVALMRFKAQLGLVLHGDLLLVMTLRRIAPGVTDK